MQKRCIKYCKSIPLWNSYNPNILWKSISIYWHIGNLTTSYFARLVNHPSVRSWIPGGQFVYGWSGAVHQMLKISIFALGGFLNSSVYKGEKFLLAGFHMVLNGDAGYWIFIQMCCSMGWHVYWVSLIWILIHSIN